MRGSNVAAACAPSPKEGCRLRPDEAMEVLTGEQADPVGTVSEWRNVESLVVGAAVATTLSSDGFVSEVGAWSEDAACSADSSKTNSRGSWLGSDGLWARRDFSVAFTPFGAVSARPSPNRKPRKSRATFQD